MHGGRMARVEQVAVGVVLVDLSPRIAPVVEDLAAEIVAPDAPAMPVAALGEILVPGPDVVEVADLVRDVIEARASVHRARHQEAVVVGVLGPAVTAAEM